MQHAGASPAAAMPHPTDGDAPDRLSVLFTVTDGPGALERVLHVFRECQVSLRHLESRPSRNSDRAYDFMGEFELSGQDAAAQMSKLNRDLAKVCDNVTMITRDPSFTHHSGNGRVMLMQCNWMGYAHDT